MPLRSFTAARRRSCASTGGRGTILDDKPLSVDPDEVLEVSASVDLVWIDEVDGDLVWAVNPWGVNVIDKNGDDIFVVGEDGDIIDQGNVDDSSVSVDRRRPSR